MAHQGFKLTESVVVHFEYFTPWYLNGKTHSNPLILSAPTGMTVLHSEILNRQHINKSNNWKTYHEMIQTYKYVIIFSCIVLPSVFIWSPSTVPFPWHIHSSEESSLLSSLLSLLSSSLELELKLELELERELELELELELPSRPSRRPSLSSALSFDASSCHAPTVRRNTRL